MIALRLLPIVFAFAVQQDEFPAWIEQLGHESIEVRDQAMRRLGALKASDIPRLEKARDGAADAGVRSRIAAIIEHIRVSAELGKVLSPTRRYTKSGKGLKFSEVIRDLAGLVEGKFSYDEEEEERTVDLDLANVTWWEALDRTMEAAGLRYWFTGGRDRKPKLRWTAKRPVPMPVAYLEQFRIAVQDARRYEFREPGRRSDVGLVTVQVWHQPDLRPERGWFGDAVKIESIKDAKGEEAMTDGPDWNRGTSWNTSSVSADLAHHNYAWVRPDAELPLAIKGTATINFAKNTRETVIDLAGAERKIVQGAVTISVVSFTQSRAASKLKLRAEANEADGDFDRIVDDLVHVEDAEGRRHKGSRREARGPMTTRSGTSSCPPTSRIRSASCSSGSGNTTRWRSPSGSRACGCPEAQAGPSGSTCLATMAGRSAGPTPRYHTLSGMTQMLGPSAQSPKHIARDTRTLPFRPLSFTIAFNSFCSAADPRLAQASSPGSLSLQQTKITRS